MEVGKKFIGCDTVDKKFDAIEELLEEHRDSTMNLLSHAKVKTGDSKPQTKKPAAHTATATKHQCDKSTRCNEDRGILGCIKLYEIKAVDDRINWLRKKKLCFKCGNQFTPTKFRGHRCSWINGKDKT